MKEDPNFVQKFKDLLRELLISRVKESDTLHLSLQGLPQDYAYEILLSNVASVVLLWIKKGGLSPYFKGFKPLFPIVANLRRFKKSACDKCHTQWKYIRRISFVNLHIVRLRHLVHRWKYVPRFPHHRQRSFHLPYDRNIKSYEPYSQPSSQEFRIQ